MIRRLTFILAFVSGWATIGFTQQDPQYSQFVFDKLSVNPGYAGHNGDLCITLLGRKQWTNFGGEPKTGLLNAHMPIDRINSGIGVTIFLDELGQENSFIGRLHYSYQFKNVGPGKLGAGLSIGVVNKSLSADWVAIDDYTLDDAIPNSGTSNSVFDLGLGFYYSTQKLYVGLSSTHLSEGEMKDLHIVSARHYYIQGGYKHDIGSVQIQPNILIKSDAASTQVDLNILGEFKERIWAGISYRADDAFVPMIGFKIPVGEERAKLKIGYSYDLTTSELKNFSDGGHELMLNYCVALDKPLPPQIYKNPRFL